MKKNRVIDCFLFFNELDLLEIRLNVLNEVVDTFVLVESTVSHSGLKKKLHYKNNKGRFSEFNHKIVHCVVDDTPNSFEEAQQRFVKGQYKDELEKNILLHCLTTSNVPKGETQWLREFYQHESVRRGLLMSGANDDDVCFVSDLDEIWNPNLECDFEDEYNVTKLKQDVHIGFLNLKSSEQWYGTYYTKYKNLKNASHNHLDTVSKTQHVFVDNGGWHFTYQGGIEKVITKLENYGHQEYNNDLIKSMVQQRLDSGMDVLGRPFPCEVNEDRLPLYIKKNRKKYEHLFKSI